jgi:hypothetical protein
MGRPQRILTGLDVHKDTVFLCIRDNSKAKIFEKVGGVGCLHHSSETVRIALRLVLYSSRLVHIPQTLPSVPR